MADNFFGITDIGKVSENNEDEFIAQKAISQDVIIAGVIDGVGGYHGGEIAAAIAKECLIKLLGNITGDIIPAIKAAFYSANAQIFAEKKQDTALQNMACVLTMAMVDVPNNQLYYAHVGDTRLYLLRDDNLVKISKDHSFVGFLEDSGRLTEQDAMNHIKRNEINKALGFEEVIENNEEFIETGQSPFLPGDLLLICSDGLTDIVNKEDITAILTAASTLKQKGTMLIDAANQNGGKDNITVVLVKNDKPLLQHAATKPIALQQETIVIKGPAHQPKKTITGQPAPKRKGSGVLIVILSVLCVVFLASTLWFYYCYTNGPQPVAQTPLITTPVVKQHVRNAQEIKLQDTINKLKGNTLILSAADFKQPIIISDSLLIQRDSLHIKTKGAVILMADTSYNGVGLIISSKCKHIVLDSLTIQGFGTAIVARSNSLTLKNIRFVNCNQSLVQSFIFKDKKYISGKLPVSTFSTDSLPKHPAN